MSAEGEETVKSEPKPEGQSEQINIKVKAQDGQVTHFKAKKTMKFQKLFKAYCERQGHAQESVAFLYDGTRIKPDQTPEELDMEEDDCIDVMIHQIGGRAPA